MAELRTVHFLPTQAEEGRRPPLRHVKRGLKGSRAKRGSAENEVLFDAD